MITDYADWKAMSSSDRDLYPMTFSVTLMLRARQGRVSGRTGFIACASAGTTPAEVITWTRERRSADIYEKILADDITCTMAKRT